MQLDKGKNKSKNKKKHNASVVQLDRKADFGSEIDHPSTSKYRVKSIARSIATLQSQK